MSATSSEGNGEAVQVGTSQRMSADRSASRGDRGKGVIQSSGTPSSVSKGEKDDQPSNHSPIRWLREKCAETVTHDVATIPLAWQALLTGLVDALLYSKSQIWTGFQTGNMVQFSENIAEYMLPGAQRSQFLTLLRALSFISFLVGSFVGAKAGAYFGDNKRGWQVASAFIQSVLLFGASAILLSRPEDEAPTLQYWTGVVIMTALSMGMQSIAAQKLTSPAFATTVAFTATLSQIASDPYLFTLTLSPIDKWRAQRQGANIEASKLESGTSQSPDKPKTPVTLGRDRRLLGIFFLCTGAGVARCIYYSSAGVRGGLTVAAGFKMVQALLWLFVAKGQKPKRTAT